MKIFKRVFSVLLAILLTPLISTVAYAKSTNDVTFNSGKAYLDTGWADDEFMIAFNWTSTKKVTNYGIYIWDSEGNDVEGVDTLDKYNVNMGPGTYNCLFCVYAVEPDGSTLGELYVGETYTWQGYVVCDDGSFYFSPEYSFKLTLNGSRFKNITSPTVNYLALSYLSYRNLNGYVDKTVRDYINKQYDKSFQGTDISLYQLCKGVLDYKILTTSQQRGTKNDPGFYIDTDQGFYAVTFYNEETGEVVIAYRGSATIEKLLSPYAEVRDDAIADWFENDFTFQVHHRLTPQLQYAIEYLNYNIDHCSVKLKGSWNITATGHSLGGALATTVSMARGVYAEVFNSASVYEALYSNKPELMGKHFEGVDLWWVRSHINQHDNIISKWEDEFRNLRHVVYEDTNKTNVSHSLSNMVYKDPDGNVRMSAPAEYHRLENIPEAFSTTANGNKIYFGSSQDDAIRHRTKKDALIYGGRGSDKIYCYEKTNDVIIGGSSFEDNVDIVTGGHGNDTYIFYPRGGGKETIIKDVGGSDCLKITNDQGPPPPSNISYQETTIGGESFVLVEIGPYADVINLGNVYYDRIYISLNRDSNSNFVVVDELSQTETLLIGKWGKFRSVLISCPVDIDIFDPDGNLVLTLEHETELDVSTPFGNFHVFTDENGESCKYYDLMDGYTAQIRGVGEGTMDVNVIHDGDNPNSPGSGVMNVPITPTTTATINYSAGNVPVLSITDASGTTDISLQTRHEITLLPENGEDPYTEFTEFDNSVPELPTPYRSGYTFLGWKSSEGSFVDKGDLLTEDITLKAQWKSNSTKTINNNYYWWYLTAISNRYFDVKADTTEGGEVVLSATRIKYDKSITLSIMPDEGYMIDQFILNGQVIPIKDSSVTLYNIRCDQTIFVSFKKIS